MSGELLELITKELLEKFGAGNHKPGSGSAAAFNGLLAAQLVITVIEITCDDKHKKSYEEHVPRLEEIRSDIKENIYPELARLFQLDSDEFDKVIKLRKLRNKEEDPIKKKELAKKAKEALIPAVEIPREIARLCLKISNYASFVFRNGFKSARGDSGQAFSSANSAVSGCLSIIYLNLQSCPKDEWKEQVRIDTQEIYNEYHSRLKLEKLQHRILEDAIGFNEDYESDIQQLRSDYWSNNNPSLNDIEDLVKKVQNTMWKYRKKIWKDDVPKKPIDILQPDIALKKILGYNVSYETALGHPEDKGDSFEIAGLIDKRRKRVVLSQEFSPQTMNFTTAHELGHAFLHNQTILHRDRPIDGSSASSRDRQELQADKFAAFFLMPEKLVRKIFYELFSLYKLVINENIVFALTNSTKVDDFKKKCENLRGFAIFIATTERFGGNEFNSLADIFRVSPKTMAIRLEELDLIEF